MHTNSTLHLALKFKKKQKKPPKNQEVELHQVLFLKKLLLNLVYKSQGVIPIAAIQ